MRRLAHRLFALALAVSLALCVAACLLWARSYRAADVVHRFTPSHYTLLFSDQGRLGVRLVTYPRPVPRDPDELRFHYESVRRGIFAGPASGSVWSRLGFERAELRHPGGGYRLDIVAVPWWPVAIAVSLPWVARAATAGARRRRQHRRRLGLCHSCGYDLRASPGRCPECGAEKPG